MVINPLEMFDNGKDSSGNHDHTRMRRFDVAYAFFEQFLPVLQPVLCHVMPGQTTVGQPGYLFSVTSFGCELSATDEQQVGNLETPVVYRTLQTPEEVSHASVIGHGWSSVCLKLVGKL